MSAFVLKQNDTRPKLTAVLYDKFGTPQQEPLDLTGAIEVQFIMRAADAEDPELPKVKGFCVVIDAVEGVVVYTWKEGDTDIVGDFNGEFEITWADGGIESVPNRGYFEIEVTDDLG